MVTTHVSNPIQKSKIETADAIILKGIRTHNLKNIDVTIPHGTLTVITGVSGSGKSSLAFNTLYAEGRRRYVESLSAYSRQFLERIEKPDLDFVSGILPAIAIEVKNVITNARSTVGTQTELNDYLRLLFSRVGVTYCSSCGKEVKSDSPTSILEKAIHKFENHQVTVAFPLFLEKNSRAFRRQMCSELERQGFLSFLVSGKQVGLEDIRNWKKGNGDRQSSPERFLVIVDQLELKQTNRSRFLDSLETALQYGKGSVSIFSQEEGKLSEKKFSSRFHCADCNIEYRLPDPNSFSFNSPLGACPECQGFGRIITIDQDLVIPNPSLSISEGAIEPWTKPSASWEFRKLKQFCRRKHIPMDVPFSKLKEEERKWILKGLKEDKDYFSVRDFFEYLEKKTYKMHVRIFLSKYRGFQLCPKCHGTRLKPEALAVKINRNNMAQLSALTIESLQKFFGSLALSEHELAIAESILSEIKNRLSFLTEVGLGYLTLDRLSRTLSGGEAQRIHLAASLGSALVDTLYVLDEPSVGLHERDNALLIRLLGKLRNLGNTVVVVEHDRTMIEAADQIIDLGPLGGERGGEIVFSGPFSELSSARNSCTARYFQGELKIERNGKTQSTKLQTDKTLRVVKAQAHNLKEISVEIPLQQFVVITGVSGSGKSTFLYDILYANYQRFRGRPAQDIGKVDKIEGFKNIQDTLLVDQSPIGKTPRSNPVTYVKAFDQIRKIFARTKEAKMRHLEPGHFSFNVPGGRCEQCEGAGVEKIEMHFLADMYVTCEACGGSRYQPHILEIRYQGKNIRDVLDITIEEALIFFSAEGGSASRQESRRGSPSAAGGKGGEKICESLSILSQVGLGYLRLGQAAPTLSGGEAQRLKLAAELSHAASENLLYLFDEPTTGLHYYDIAFLLSAFETLLNRGHSVCVIEHNMEVIKCADYVIDLGPEGGESGGEVIYAGSVDGLLKEPRSHTGRALRGYLERNH